MKILGIVLSVVGAICGAVGYIQFSSWEYQLTYALGTANETPNALMCIGTVTLVVGIVMIISSVVKEKATSNLREKESESK